MLIRFFLPLLVVAAPSFCQDSLDSLVVRVGRRIEAYQAYDAYSAAVTSNVKIMDGDWKPEKVIRTEKKAFRKNGEQGEEIIQAVESEKGKERDITQKAREESAKSMEKSRRREKAGKDGTGGQVRLGLEGLIPFSNAKRPDYSFTLLPDTVVSGVKWVCVQALARQKDSERYEGRYWIDPDTYDIRLMDVRPSKNPKFVKDLRMRFSFDVLPENRMVVTRTWMRVFAGIVIKKFRMELEETYSDYRFE
jgi:hypothetical protein